MSRTTIRTLIALGALLGAAAPASALQVGISEQRAAMFADPLFAPLQMHYGRLVVPWNIALQSRARRAPVNDWIEGAAATGVEPHVAFNVVGYERRYQGKGPTPRQYLRAVTAFRKRWPAVRVFTPWNEANHYFQPTARRPELAARYYTILRRSCPRCQVVAADVLDDKHLGTWLRRFKRALPRGVVPRLWGLHNYQDSNRRRPLSRSWTLRLTRLVKGTIWATESGGVVGFQSPTGRTVWQYSPTRAANATRYLLRLLRAPQVRTRYQRVYIYNFYGAWEGRRRLNRWDSGLLSVGGRPRPAYDVVRRAAALSLRAQPR